MRRVCLAGGRIAHLLSVAVVSGNQQLAAHFFNRLSHFTQAVIQCFNRFDCGFHDAGVANHIAVRVVTDNGVVLTAFDSSNQFLGQLSGAHFRLQVIGGHFRGVDQNTIFALEWVFYAAVEEEGHVCVFLSFRDAQLGFIVLRHPLTEGVFQ